MQTESRVFIRGQDQPVININSKQTDFPAGNAAKCKAKPNNSCGDWLIKGAGMSGMLQAAPESHKSSAEPSCPFPSPGKLGRRCSSGSSFAEFGAEMDFHPQQIFLRKHLVVFFLFLSCSSSSEEILPCEKHYNAIFPLIFCSSE